MPLLGQLSLDKLLTCLVSTCSPNMREIVSVAVAVNHFCHNTGSSLLKPELKCLYIYFF